MNCYHKCDCATTIPSVSDMVGYRKCEWCGYGIAQRAVTYHGEYHVNRNRDLKVIVCEDCADDATQGRNAIDYTVADGLFCTVCDKFATLNGNARDGYSCADCDALFD